MKTIISAISCLAAVAWSAVLSGCGEQPTNSSQEGRLGALESQLQHQNMVISNDAILMRRLKEQVRSVQESILELQNNSGGAYTEIDLSSTSGFTTVRGRFGIFLVSVKNVEPYLDGYRVNFDVGNPFHATFSNLKIKAVWGPKLDSSKLTNEVNYVENYNASLKRKELAQADKLLPGCWNNVTIVLAPAKPEELGYFSMSLDADMVSLSTPPK